MIAKYSSRWRRTISKQKKACLLEEVITVDPCAYRKPFQTHQNDVRPHIRRQFKQLFHEMIIESNR